jgi:hypothetical protein
MTRAEIRRAAHTIIERTEWLNKNATTRRPSESRTLEFVLTDIERLALKIVDAPVKPPTSCDRTKCDHSEETEEVPTDHSEPTSPLDSD